MKTMTRYLAVAVAAFALTAAVRAADWTEDYASAVAQAKRENKMVLLDFTGSDWCVWCQRTDKEVFETQKFKDFADQKLVLVRLDFPRETFDALQRVDPAAWKREVIDHEELFIALHDHLPAEMIYERELLICRL